MLIAIELPRPPMGAVKKHVDDTFNGKYILTVTKCLPRGHL
jgi:hypothetical protein